MAGDLSKFEEKIGVVFEDKRLLEQAFTHRSYLNENRGLKLSHNERLEFLGDAVLELAVTDFLYRKYPNQPEGVLTSYRSSLVNAVTLAEIGAEIGLNGHMLLSRGEAKDTGRARQIILANAMEAVIGAIYLDQGFKVAEHFIEKHILPRISAIVEKGSFIDSKSMFQEKAQEKVGITPSYRTLREIGPDHDKQFTVGLFLAEDLVVEGSGKSKQDAEQAAARKALEKMGW
jgi:ribonuclease-3